MNENDLQDTWLMFQCEHGCSIDRMLCDPELRSRFLDAAQAAIGESDEAEILWQFVSLRKRKRLPSRLQ